MDRIQCDKWGSSGSCIRSSLFVLYINDLPDVDAGSNVHMFAEDTELCREIKVISDEDILQSDIDRMNKWSDDWLMSYLAVKLRCWRQRPIAELIDLFNYYTLDQSHRYGRHRAACREPAGSYDKTTRTAIFF